MSKPPGKIFGEAMHMRKEHGQVGCQAQDQGGIDGLRATHEPAMLHIDAHPRQPGRLTRPRK
ncbi:MAG TPA: hypothetical protein DHV65_15505 [Ktedonobacter sp.]|nr:hypothetical protein [Ktedonobacter sp.]